MAFALDAVNNLLSEDWKVVCQTTTNLDKVEHETAVVLDVLHNGQIHHGLCLHEVGAEVWTFSRWILRVLCAVNVKAKGTREN